MNYTIFLLKISQCHINTLHTKGNSFKYIHRNQEFSIALMNGICKVLLGMTIKKVFKLENSRDFD